MKTLLILFILGGCVTTQNNKIAYNRRDQDRHNFITCIKDLFNVGISEQKAHEMCTDAISFPKP